MTNETRIGSETSALVGSLLTLAAALSVSPSAATAQGRHANDDGKGATRSLSAPLHAPARPGAPLPVDLTNDMGDDGTRDRTRAPSDTETGARGPTDSEREIREGLFDVLLRFNADYWNEAYARELLLLDASSAAKIDAKDRAARSEVARTDTARKQQLRAAAARRPANEASTDAALRLAAALLVENAVSDEAGLLLEGVLEQAASVRLPRAQEWAALRMRASRHLAAKRPEAAERDFERLKRATEGAGPTAAAFAFHASVGLGDAAFARFLPSRAEASYVAALRAFQRASLAVYDELLPDLPGLYARLVWSSFRAGRSFSTSIYAAEYARRRSTFPRALPPAVEQELVRAGGISIFERGDVPFARALGSDASAGDLGKRLLLEALNEHIRSRSFAGGDALARATERDFEESPYAFEHAAARAVLSANIAGPRGKAERDFRAVSLAARDSRWSRSFARTKALDEKRRSVLRRLAEPTGAFFAEEGRRTGRKDDYLKSHMAYRARLGDFFEGESRGALLLASADAAFRAGVHESAWEDARLSFRQPLDADSEREAFVLLARVSRAQAEGALSPDDPFLNRHLGAVDAFAAEQPAAREAREFLFAVAGKLERIGALPEARARYERVLALVPRRGAAFLVELENALRALCYFHMRHSEPGVAAPALSDLEGVAQDAGVEASLLQDLRMASAAQARLESSFERRAGRLEKSAALLRQWAARHPSNPEAPMALRDAILAFHEVGDSKSALEAAESFLAEHGKHPYVWDVLRLKGLVHETDVAFHSAALSYVAAAYDDASRLDTDVRLALLKKAADFFSQGGNAKEAAGVYERIAVLSASAGSGSGSSPAAAGAIEARRAEARRTGAAPWLAKAAAQHLRAGSPALAERLYERAARSAPVAGGDVARYGLAALRARVASRDPEEGDARDAAALLARWPRGAATRASRYEALAFALELEARLLEREGRGKGGVAPRMSRLAQARATLVAEGGGDDPNATRSALLLARLTARTRPDSELPRSLTFEAFLKAPRGSEERAEAARALRAYAPVTSGELPPADVGVSYESRGAEEGNTP